MATTTTLTKPDPDPYDLGVPSNWTVSVDGGCVTYENTASTVRIRLTEFARHLRVYWWVDLYTRDCDGEWTKREAGLGDSFRDPEEAARVADVLIESVEAGDDFSQLPVIDTE